MIALLHGRGPKPERQVLQELWLEALRWRFERDFPQLLAAFNCQKKRGLYYGDLSNRFLVNEELGPLSARRAILERLKLADFNEYLGPLSYDLEEPPIDITTYWDEESDFGKRLRGRIDEELTAVLGLSEPTILIAHSLGSVLSLDSLYRCAFPGANVTLVTMGSPLTHPDFLTRIQGFPEVEGWHDLRAQGDLICGPSWSESHSDLKVEEHTLLNPAIKDGKADPHHALGYLTSPSLSKVLAAWLEKS